MKITYLGQAGLLFETDNLTVMIDPYFSDSVKNINPKNYRRVSVKEELFDIKPDVMIFTHNHLDHYDPETVSRFISEDSDVLVLAPTSVWNEVRKLGGNNNFVLFNRYTTWTENGIKFMAVKADEGENVITFRYRTPGLFEGIIISMGSAVLLIAFVLICRKVDKKLKFRKISHSYGYNSCQKITAEEIYTRNCIKNKFTTED